MNIHKITNTLVFCMMLIALSIMGFATSTHAKSVGFKSNCSVKKGAIKKSRGVWNFTLRHGDIGGCPTDRKARHGAPFWERAEVRSAVLKKNKRYEITFEIKFDPKTKSSKRTAFFQIHTYNKACRSCVPMLMVKTDATGAVYADVQNAIERHNRNSLSATRAQMAQSWTKFKIIIGTAKEQNRLSILINGRRVLNEGWVYLNPKGKPHLKMGLYRPGSRKNKLPTDRVSIRNVKTRIIK